MVGNPLCNAPIIGGDGNVYVVLGTCIRALERAGFRDEAAELKRRVMTEAEDYDHALRICMEYVYPTEAENG